MVDPEEVLGEQWKNINQRVTRSYRVLDKDSFKANKSKSKVFYYNKLKEEKVHK